MKLNWPGVVVVLIVAAVVALCIWKDAPAIVPAVAALVGTVAAWLTRSPLTTASDALK